MTQQATAAPAGVAHARRTEHPRCDGCRNEMCWHIVTRDGLREPSEGQCTSGYGTWPHGCRHYAEAPWR